MAEDSQLLLIQMYLLDSVPIVIIIFIIFIITTVGMNESFCYKSQFKGRCLSLRLDVVFMCSVLQSVFIKCIHSPSNLVSTDFSWVETFLLSSCKAVNCSIAL